MPDSPASRFFPRQDALNGNAFKDLGTRSLKEWWTPIRHAHEKPMNGENCFSLSSHGQAIRRSPLLGKRLRTSPLEHLSVANPYENSPRTCKLQP